MKVPPAGVGPPARLRLAPLRALLPLLLVAAAPGAARGARLGGSEAVTALQKVLDLLAGMLEKSKQAKSEEAAQWSAYRQFCTDTDLAKQEDVRAADMQLEVLHADIEKHKADIARLGTEIQGHEADIEGYRSDLNSSTVQRRLEHEDYERLHRDLSESIYAVSQAIEVLQKQARDRPQAAALLEKAASMASLPKEARRAIESFLARDSDEPDLAFVAPSDAEAHGYEFQSQSVINLLKELQEKFRNEKLALEKQEMGQRHAQEILAQDLHASKAAAEHEVAKKTKSKSQAAQAEVDTTSQHRDLSATRAGDMQYLEDLRTTCQQKAADFTSREQLRSEEIEAIEKAIAVLSSEQVAGAAERHLPSLLQPGRKSAVSLVQRHSSPEGQGQEQEKAAAYLKGESQRLSSHVLSALAEHVQEDPFAKVKKMVQDLIAKLQDQATEEEQHHQWCETELGTNSQTRQAKTTQVETLHTTIEQLQIDMSSLKKDIATLSREISQLQSALVKENEIRISEKARNEDTIADAVTAQMQISQAITILRDFYGAAAGATALAQRGSRSAQDFYGAAAGATALAQRGSRSAQAPAIFSEPYQGQQKEKDNVLAFLQVIQSNFARLETETSSAEQAAQQEHNQFVTDTEREKGEKTQASTTKQNELAGKEQDLQTAERDLDMAQSELDAALAYYDRLRPSCLDVGTSSSASDRVQRREEEIAALREALAILSGETIPDYGPSGLYSSVDGGNRGMEVGVTVGG